MIDLSVITGHTATGKTSRALSRAKKKGGYIISADSRQLYRDLTIVTGKDIPSDIPFTKRGDWNGKTLGYYCVEGVELWGYDLIDPDRTFSSYEFVTVAKEIIEKWGEQRPLVIVGGTYLYIKHLLDGFNQTEEPDPARRADLELLTLDQLQKISADDYGYHYESLNQSDRHNPRRLIRLIEKGDAIGEWQNGLLDEGFDLKLYEGRYIGDKDERRVQIRKRVLERIEQGAVEETESLLKTYSSDDPGLNTLGYKQLIDYLQGTCSKDQAIEDWVTAEMQYTKRQLTFMRKDTRIMWVNLTEK